MCVLHHLQSTAPWKSLLCVGVSHCVRVGGISVKVEQGGVPYLEQSSALSWCEWWWGWWAGKRWPQSPPKWCPWWTAARWPDPAGSTYTPTTTHRRTQNILISTKHRLGLGVFTETSDKCDWLQKWTQNKSPICESFPPSHKCELQSYEVDFSQNWVTDLMTLNFKKSTTVQLRTAVLCFWLSALRSAVVSEDTTLIRSRVIAFTTGILLFLFLVALAKLITSWLQCHMSRDMDLIFSCST